MDGMRRGGTNVWFARVCGLVLTILLTLGWPAQSGAYAVLAHEAIIDSVWGTHIRPLLLKRFPNATGEELKEAHGYAYGGAIIQDMGYYPHGSHFFSDLTHYVRSGDFILALLRDAKDIDGYAFALGALSHYAADNDGHFIGVNRAVPLLYPELKKKYGDSVTYEENPLAHVKTEFGFDILEVAQGRYAPDSYHDFIGFGVSVPLLEQAFQETYGLDLKNVLSDEDRVINSYRHDVSQLLPKATRIAWSLKKDEILKDQPSMTKRKFLYNLSRATYQKNWGNRYQPPTFDERLLAFLAGIVPKIGPLKVLQLRMPTPETERMFEASFNASLDRYRKLLGQVDVGQLALMNDNFDTGEVTGPGKYRLNDEVHAELLDALAKQSFSGASPEIRAELLEFYGHPDALYASKRKPKLWIKVQAQLEELKTAAPPIVAGDEDDHSRRRAGENAGLQQPSE
ncbi:MAG TPA: zinc dependent phospholipase C family protein [Candidatus Acidoferrales bacterium]|nr:zinc dependent phospholipase C family protein [Candidatus Acidoferrales bacterium]